MHDRLIDMLTNDVKRRFSNSRVELFVILDVDRYDRPVWNIRTEFDNLKTYLVAAPISSDDLKPSITAAVNHCWSEYIKIHPQHHYD